MPDKSFCVFCGTQKTQCSPRFDEHTGEKLLACPNLRCEHGCVNAGGHHLIRVGTFWSPSFACTSCDYKEGYD